MSSVVIGAGLAGISAALTLQDAGEEVELFEASDAVGGRVRSDYVDGYILDRGFQLINSGYPEIKRLGVIGEIDFKKSSRTVDVVTPFGISSIGDPRLHPLQALRSPLGTFREKLSVLTFLGDKPNSNISLRDALLASGTGDLYENVLRPFLRGVFLAELEAVDSSYGREMMRSFIVGDSGLPSAGAGTLSEALAARVSTVHLNAAVDSLAQFDGKKIILATDAATTARLLGRPVESKFVDSYTWYHSLPAGVISTSHLRVTSTANPIVSSVAISNFAPQYAPEGRTLISSTALSSMSDDAALNEIAKFWGIAPSEFELVKRYEIRNSLPLFEPGKSSVTTNPRVAENIYLAGDYLTSGSQNGALLSGRLAALELLLDKS
jgi:Flavin containing amine oxidoreductase